MSKACSQISITDVTDRGVSSITEEYYLSTSKTEQVGGKWSSNPPTWENNKYIWTRTKIIYSDSNIPEYTEPICDSSWEAVNDIQIGGRNLLLNSDFTSDFTVIPTSINDFGMFKRGTIYTVTRDVDVTHNDKPSLKIVGTAAGNSSDENIVWRFVVGEKNKVVSGSFTGRSLVLSFWAKSENCSNFNARFGYDSFNNSRKQKLTTEWDYYVILMTDNASAEWNNDMVFMFDSADTVYLSEVKLEYSNGKATDWTPAPEDVEDNINNINDKHNQDLSGIDNRITNISFSINELKNMLSSLVTDETGGSLMTQTASGWVFSMSKYQTALNEIKETIEKLEENKADSLTIEELEEAIHSLNGKTSYVLKGETESGQPCILLGEQDSDFKLRITNTSIDFMENESKVAYISDGVFFGDKIIAEKTLQIGTESRFVWETRENGNLGLVYISG